MSQSVAPCWGALIDRAYMANNLHLAVRVQDGLGVESRADAVRPVVAAHA